ncbi:dynamin family protein [Streptomyces flavotricini]|uniref:Dynamin family protein n=1 Tax=Streptomyces flavotricini TaxID=66888 RepID=A0ABS8EBI5_9ACTN|nr:dynamin family protein [Streptomyces flavotricini]MCC0098079.1 dynamin family protein [Streptomyces flavotricini]
MAHENRRLAAGQESPAVQFRGWSENIGTLRSYYQRLQQVAGEAAAVIAPPGTPGAALDLGINGAVFERETFRIMVLGEFSSGKSTLINALLGKRLLPTKANPATAFTTVLRWGETERAWLYRDGDRRGGETAVTTEEFKREVALQLDAHGAPRTPSFALAVVEQPLELLRRSVEIVDSAGINESADRELVTLRYLEEVDAVVFVTDAGRPFTLHETENYLTRVRKLGHRDIFFVVNQFDRIEEEERAEVMSRCRNAVAELSGESGPAAANVFFISALQALRSRTGGDAEGLRASGIGQLESALEVFCMRDAARVKFVRLAEFLRHNAVNLRVRLHDEGAVLMKSTAELRELLDRSQSTQDQLRTSADAIRDIVSSKILGIEHELQRRFAEFLTEISCEIHEWHITTGPGRLTRAVRSFTRGGRVAAQHELMEAYTVQLQERMQIFCAQELDQVIEEGQGDLVRQLEPLIRAHADLLDKLREELTGSQAERDQNHLIYTLAIAAGKGKAGESRRLGDDVPLMFRPSSLMMYGAGGGAALGVGAAAAAAAAGLISLALPPVGVAVAIGVAMGPLLASGAVLFAPGKLQTRAAEEFATHVKDSADQTARQYAGSRAADLREMWGGISGTLHLQLQDLIGIVQRNIEESRQDEQAKAGMRDQLYAFEQRITDVEQYIANFLQPFVSEAEREQV